MSRKSVLFQAFACRNVLFVAGSLLAGLLLTSCDRGASTQIEAARKFADAVARNEAAKRDSMIATYRYLEHFQNPYVASDNLSWFRTFYDYQEQKFRKYATADVDYDLKKRLQGALITPEEIEETGMVRVRSPLSGEDDAMFWMVKQQGRPWRIAMVTKGEMLVNF
jgi:hypothetical protein